MNHINFMRSPFPMSKKSQLPWSERRPGGDRKRHVDPAHTSLGIPTCESEAGKCLTRRELMRTGDDKWSFGKNNGDWLKF